MKINRILDLHARVNLSKQRIDRVSFGFRPTDPDLKIAAEIGRQLGKRLAKIAKARKIVYLEDLFK